MSTKRAFAILVSYAVANQLTTGLPAMSAPDLSNILSSIAAKNGMVAINANAPQTSTQASMPTKSDVMSAIHHMPAAVNYSQTGMPLPTPTNIEALTLIAPESDFNVIGANGVNPIFGTITQADETLTGLFDDLSNTDMSQYEPVVDPSLFNDDPNADLSTGITSPTANLVSTIMNPQATNLLQSTISLDPTGTQLEVQTATPATTTSDSTGGLNTADMSVLVMPSMFCTPEDRPVAVSEAGAQPALLLQGYVKEDAEYPNFVHPDKDYTVNLPHGHSLNVHRGGLAWIEMSKDYLKVRAGSNGVTVDAPNGQHISLNAGEEALWVVAGVDGVKFMDDGLAKRRVAHHALADGSTLYVSEFSIVHFLKHEDADGVETPKVRDRLLKTAAAINVACRNHGRYQLVRKIALAR